MLMDDDKALRVLNAAVEAIWGEALFMLTLTPLQSERYHKLRLALHLRKYDQMPAGEIKDFLPKFINTLGEALRARQSVETWAQFMERPEVLDKLAGLQKAIVDKLEED